MEVVVVAVVALELARIRAPALLMALALVLDQSRLWSHSPAERADLVQAAVWRVVETAAPGAAVVAAVAILWAAVRHRWAEREGDLRLTCLG